MDMGVFGVQNTQPGAVESWSQTGSSHTLGSDMSQGNRQAMASKKTHTPLHSAIANGGVSLAWFPGSEENKYKSNCTIEDWVG